MSIIRKTYFYTEVVLLIILIDNLYIYNVAKRNMNTGIIALIAAILILRKVTEH